MLSFIDSTGHERFLGNINAPLKVQWRTYGDDPTTPMIHRDKWKPISLKPWTSPVRDQDGIGSCNAHAIITALESCRRFAGLDTPLLSPGHLYGRINGGRDQGSTLEDGMAEIRDVGVCTAAKCPELEWRRRTPESIDECKLYRMTEVWLCPTFDHLASAILSGYHCVIGIPWHDNFEPDRDGWLPSSPRGRSGGHALCRDGLAQRGGQWGLDGPNSWGTRWGKDGYCVIPESLFRGPIGGWWAARVSVQEDGDLPVAK